MDNFDNFEDFERFMNDLEAAIPHMSTGEVIVLWAATLDPATQTMLAGMYPTPTCIVN